VVDTTGQVRALVVYESMFGNTEAVAGAVAHGLQLGGVDTGLVEVRSAPRTLSPELDLVVVGGPTHAFSLSRPSTREDAVRKGAPPQRATLGVREWLGSCRSDRVPALQLAAFDTRVTTVRWLPRSAASAAARLARRRGFRVTAPPVSFLVDDVSGPLVDGELEEATAWGRQLAVACRDRLVDYTLTTRAH
jgi:hypothetical protein